MQALYTAEATAVGGRRGHVRSSDGVIDLDLAIPKELGGPGGGRGNPEQLFAACYAACFQSALAAVARREDTDVDESAVTARVGIGRDDTGFGLEVELVVSIPGVDRSHAEALVHKAHEFCPYSKATRGNIDVTLTVAE
ncbi:MAG TPA: organic hydroperoxide resistance protein [Actinomycetes bacterium]|jgi:Ohr subfamily peroxiredoxin|nr:organic hydroperoxide resistance protein [Actinomycetes bacterium]